MTPTPNTTIENEAKGQSAGCAPSLSYVLISKRSQADNANRNNGGSRDYEAAAGADHHETKRNIQPFPASPLVPLYGACLGGFAVLFIAGLVYLLVEVL